MPSTDSAPSEKSHLVHKSTPNNPSNTSKSFIIAESLTHEVKLMIQRTSMMTLQMLCQLGSPVVAMIFVGQLPDSVIYLSAVGLARTFVNVTGTAMAWGFTTSLFTLLPQSIGAGQTNLASIYVQRAFYVTTIVSCFLCIIQFFAGDIMVALGQPPELAPLINRYCRILIPYIFLTAYSTVFTRLLQSLDLQIGLTYCCVISMASCPLFVWLFMYPLQMGYLGAAMGQNLVLVMFCLTQFTYLAYKGYASMFKPLPLFAIWTKKGMSHYINLAIPGLFQNAFQWIIEEVAVLLAGYIIHATTAISTTVILINVYLVVIPFPIGTTNSVNLRVGKYIGLGDIYKAKRSAKLGVGIASVLLIIWALILILGRNVIPRIYTDDKDTIELTSRMIFIMVTYAASAFICLTIGGIYRGLGFQKIAAIFAFVSFWIITWPIAMGLLFGVGFRENLTLGVATIWLQLVCGNFLAGIGLILYMICFVDWNKAVIDAQSRIKTTMREYQSTKASESVNG